MYATSAPNGHAPVILAISTVPSRDSAGEPGQDCPENGQATLWLAPRCRLLGREAISPSGAVCGCPCCRQSQSRLPRPSWGHRGHCRGHFRQAAPHHPQAGPRPNQTGSRPCPGTQGLRRPLHDLPPHVKRCPRGDGGGHLRLRCGSTHDDECLLTTAGAGLTTRRLHDAAVPTLSHRSQWRPLRNGGDGDGDGDELAPHQPLLFRPVRLPRHCQPQVRSRQAHRHWQFDAEPRLQFGCPSHSHRGFVVPGGGDGGGADVPRRRLLPSRW